MLELGDFHTVDYELLIKSQLALQIDLCAENLVTLPPKVAGNETSVVDLEVEDATPALGGLLLELDDVRGLSLLFQLARHLRTLASVRHTHARVRHTYASVRYTYAGVRYTYIRTIHTLASVGNTHARVSHTKFCARHTQCELVDVQGLSLLFQLARHL